MKHVAIYLRVSTDHQTTGSQEQYLREACENRGILAEDCRLYVDQATSGSSWTRKSLDALMRDCEAGKVAMVVAYKLDRLGRSLAHLAQLWMRFEELGVALWVPSQGIDTSAMNPAAKLQMQVLAAVAEFEREVIRERVKAGLQNARANGVKLGRPKGFRPGKSRKRLKGERLIDETELWDKEIAGIVGVTRKTVWTWRREMREERLRAYRESRESREAGKV